MKHNKFDALRNIAPSLEAAGYSREEAEDTVLKDYTDNVKEDKSSIKSYTEITGYSGAGIGTLMTILGFKYGNVDLVTSGLCIIFGVPFLSVSYRLVALTNCAKVLRSSKDDENALGHKHAYEATKGRISILASHLKSNQALKPKPELKVLAV